MVKKALLVVPERGFGGQTYLTLRGTLDYSGVAVFTSSSTLEACVAEDGLVVKPDFRNVDVKASDWDAIVFLDGPGSSAYWLDSTAHTLCQIAWAADRVIGAIGSAVVTVANSGIATDLRIATPPDSANLLSAKGGILSGNPVEVDGNLVTASDGGAAEQFAAAVVDLLKGQNRSKMAGAA